MKLFPTFYMKGFVLFSSDMSVSFLHISSSLCCPSNKSSYQKNMLKFLVWMNMVWYHRHIWSLTLMFLPMNFLGFPNLKSDSQFLPRVSSHTAFEISGLPGFGPCCPFMNFFFSQISLNCVFQYKKYFYLVFLLQKKFINSKMS